MGDTDKSDLIEDGKNKLEVRCRHCESVVLKPRTAAFIVEPFDLPKPDATANEMEPLKEYWTVADMFSFENVGFSHTRDSIKYLVCADCELGPIGYHEITTKKSYIALERVKHV